MPCGVKPHICEEWTPTGRALKHLPVSSFQFIHKQTLSLSLSLPLRRASEDPEKTNTTYVEDSQPTQGKEQTNKKNKIVVCSSFSSQNPLVHHGCSGHIHIMSLLSNVSVTQRSPSVWTSRMPSRCRAVRRERRSASSPPGPLAAGCPSTSLRSTSKRRRRRTRAGGRDSAVDLLCCRYPPSNGRPQ